MPTAAHMPAKTTVGAHSHSASSTGGSMATAMLCKGKDWERQQQEKERREDGRAVHTDIICPSKRRQSEKFSPKAYRFFEVFFWPDFFALAAGLALCFGFAFVLAAPGAGFILGAGFGAVGFAFTAGAGAGAATAAGTAAAAAFPLPFGALP